MAIGTYALASNLRGFASSTLRVKVTRVNEAAGLVWVRTADLLSAGVPLVLSADQVTAIVPETVSFHKTGLVAFA